MIKLLNLVDNRHLVLETEEKELPEEFTVSERGLAYLKQRIELMNKKAVKYKVPTIDIDIIKTEMVKTLKPEYKNMQFGPGALTGPGSEAFFTLTKKFTIRIDGEPPHIEGYEFIARLEHTPEGNFIYTNPKSSVPNLPAEFKTMNQHCDVCHTNRDRNDTFVIRMEKEDPERFPDKKAGDMLIVGRNCLARFLPGISVAGLMMWTKLVDNIHDDVKAASEMEEGGGGGGGGGGKYYEDTEHLLKYLVATYLHTGYYISKKQAQANFEAGKSGESTLQRALTEMNPNLMQSKDPHKSFPIYFRLKEDEAFNASVEKMMKDFEAWLPTKNWAEMAAKKPDFADFFHNLELVSKQDYLRGNHFGFFSALFQLFIRDQKDAEKKAEAEKQVAALPPSPVTFNETLIGKRIRDVAKEAEINRLKAGGLDDKAVKKAIRGKVWGWETTCKKITEYEKTQTFGYGDAGIGYRIFFRDEFGNDFLWFASNNPGFEEGGKYIIDGTITRFEAQNKYSGRPQTVINRVKIVKDYQHPEVPPQAEPAPETPPAATPPATPPVTGTPPPSVA